MPTQSSGSVKPPAIEWASYRVQRERLGLEIHVQIKAETIPSVRLIGMCTPSTHIMKNGHRELKTQHLLHDEGTNMGALRGWGL